MGARLTWLVAVSSLALGCDGTIGSNDLGGDLRSIDAGIPPIDIPDGSIDPPTVDAGIGGAGGTSGAGGTGAATGTGGAGAGGAGTGGLGGGSGSPCADGPWATPLPGCEPTPVPDTGDIHADCVARINQFRWECQCLPPLDRWVDGEACADANAQYDSVNGPHASFQDQPCGTGARGQNECPGWSSNGQVIDGCLQLMWDEGPEDGDPDTVNGHYMSMSSTTYTRVACGFYTTTGGLVWGVQNFD